MAKLNNASLAAAENASFISLLASLGVMLCMLVSLLGIKLWWFKHRLTFDQSSTSNGAAGGTQPAVKVQRQRKDKRLSQHEPFMEYGVFRKRQEDEFDVVPTQQLPPVRLRKLSQSTPNLLFPPVPKRRNNAQSTVFEEFEPPARQPPRPPISLSPTPTPTPEVVPTFEEFNKQFKKLEIPTNARLKTESSEELKTTNAAMEQHNLTDIFEPTMQIQHTAEPIVNRDEIFEPLPPQVPKRVNRNNSNSMQVFEEALYQQLQEAEQFNNELADERLGFDDKSSLDAQRNKQFESMEFMQQAEVEDIEKDMARQNIFEPSPRAVARQNRGITNDAPSTERKFLKSKSSLEPDWKKVNERRLTGYFSASEEVQKMLVVDNMQPSNAEESSERRPTGYIKKYEQTDVIDLENYREQRNNWEIKVNEIRTHETNVSDEKDVNQIENLRYDSKQWQESHDYEPQSMLLLESEDDNDDANDKEVSKINDPYLNINQIHVEESYALPRSVKFDLEEQIENKESTLQMRRPTGYVRNSEEIWEELAQANSQAPDEREYNQLWLELEKGIDKDLSHNVNEEFEKIRHSFLQDEGDFLEIEAKHKSTQLDGFGKNIDDDWVNFENLQPVSSVTIEEIKDDDEGPQIKGVKFDLPDSELELGEEKESTLRIARRPTGYVRNVEELHRELSWEGENNEDDIEQSDKQTTTSILKQRRSTGYTKRVQSLDIEEIEDDKAIHVVEEHIKIIKTKPRQKVTFDFNTEEHLIPTLDEHQQHQYTDDEDDDDEPEFHMQPPTIPPPELPKPMQRMTKMRYFEAEVENYNLTPPSAPAPASTQSILFGTQVSQDESNTSTESDSWSAIRQHRYLTEEFQQISKNQVVMQPAPREPPQAAYRNPLAQMAMRHAAELREQREEIVVKPRTTRKQKHDLENFGTNSTEA